MYQAKTSKSITKTSSRSKPTVAFHMGLTSPCYGYTIIIESGPNPLLFDLLRYSVSIRYIFALL